MRTSPSSSSTKSTSITLESPQSLIGFLVLSVFGLRSRAGIRDERRGVLIVRVWDRVGELGGHRFLRHRQREAEPRAAGEGGVEPDLAAEVLNDLAGHGQADAGARVRAPLVQPLEDHEDALSVLRLDPDPVVAEREQPERLVTAGPAPPP